MWTGPVSSKMERIKVGTHHGTVHLIVQPLYHIRYLLICSPDRTTSLSWDYHIRYQLIYTADRATLYHIRYLLMTMIVILIMTMMIQTCEWVRSAARWRGSSWAHTVALYS